MSQLFHDRTKDNKVFSMHLLLYRDSQNVHLTCRVIKIAHYNFLMKEIGFLYKNDIIQNTMYRHIAITDSHYQNMKTRKLCCLP